jgi:hypothetical protein
MVSIAFPGPIVVERGPAEIKENSTRKPSNSTPGRDRSDLSSIPVHYRLAAGKRRYDIESRYGLRDFATRFEAT